MVESTVLVLVGEANLCGTMSTKWARGLGGSRRMIWIAKWPGVVGRRGEEVSVREGEGEKFIGLSWVWKGVRGERSYLSGYWFFTYLGLHGGIFTNSFHGWLWGGLIFKNNLISNTVMMEGKNRNKQIILMESCAHGLISVCEFVDIPQVAQEA